MCHASIPHKFWDEIFSSIVYLINRLPSHNIIPYTTLFHKTPDYTILRVLGCLCFPFTRPYNKHKLQLRALPCVFLGYGLSQKRYRCLDLSSNKIFISRNVQFDEHHFPFKELSTQPQPGSAQSLGPFPLPLLACDSSSRPTDQLPAPRPNSSSSAVALHPLPPAPLPSAPLPPDPTPPPDPLSSDPTPPPAPLTTPDPLSLAPLPPQPVLPTPSDLPSSNSTDPFHSFSDLSSNPRPLPDTPYQTNLSSQSASLPNSLPSSSIDHLLPPINSHTMVTRSKDQTRRPKQFSQFIAHHTRQDIEPVTFSQAQKSQNWRDAMSAELNALANNKTWTLVPPPIDQKIIGSKWVYKLKRKTNGEIDRYKARLVAKGYNQQPGVDYEETYSPVIRATTIRVILSLAISSNWKIKQLDVSNAFLNGDLSERVYMAQPQGFQDSTHPDYVCLLHKSLYGLKQAPRAWFEKLSTTLLSLNFKPSSYDPSLFLCHSPGHILIILVYVDDLIVTGTNSAQITHCIAQLKAHFAIRDLGDLHYFLGIESTFTSQGLFLSQTKYITDLLHRANMTNTKPCLTPMASGTNLFQDIGPDCSDPVLYRSIVGALQYATLTWPDISFSVNKVSQFMHKPTEEH